MAHSDCPDRETLYALLVGTLDEPAADRVVDHLGDCPACRSAVDGMDESADAIISRLRRFSNDLADPLPRQEAALERLLVNAVALGDSLGDAPVAPSDRGGVPDRLGEYRLLEKLGEGGMGAVYKAEHTKLKRMVAVKILPADRMAHGNAVACFEREMAAIGRLKHPNIVQASDAREINGIHFLVMEYIVGPTLSELVARCGPLRMADACELVRQAAVGLQYAHQNRLVHRDIKPSNLMLSAMRSAEFGTRNEDHQSSSAFRTPRSAVVKILDLGLALVLEGEDQLDRDLTGSGQIAGTIDYMAPEQCADSHTVDIRADIYSMGATMHKLLVGRAALDAGGHHSPLNKVAALIGEEAPSLAQRFPKAPAELVAVVDRMMAKNPQDRFSTPGEVAAALEPFCGAADLMGLLKSTSDETGDGPSLPEMKDTDEYLSQPMTGTHPDSRKGGENDKVPTRQQPETAQAASATAPEAAGRGTESDGSKSRRRLLGVAAATAGIVLLAVVLTYAFRGGEVVIEADDPNIQVSIRQADEEVAVVDADNNWTVRLSPGDYRVEVRGGNDRFQIDRDTITVTRGSKRRIRITRRPAVSSTPRLAVAPFDAVRAREYQVSWARHLGVPVQYENSIGMTLRLVPPGEFLMGSSQQEIDGLLREADDTMRPRILAEGPQHTVRMTRPFYIGIHEVTVGQFGTFVQATGFRTYAETRRKKSEFNWKNVDFEQTDEHPVVYVNWDDAVAFCQWLSTSEGHLYRLPSEAQWEYACRAGSHGRWCFGDDPEQLDQFAWSDGEGPRHVVGGKRANGFGIYDMHGNAIERCQDWFAADYYGVAPTDDPEGPATGTMRVTRSGFGLLSAPARSALRSENHAKTPLSLGGIRVVRILR